MKQRARNATERRRRRQASRRAIGRAILHPSLLGSCDGRTGWPRSPWRRRFSWPINRPGRGASFGTTTRTSPPRTAIVERTVPDLVRPEGHATILPSAAQRVLAGARALGRCNARLSSGEHRVARCGGPAGGGDSAAAARFPGHIWRRRSSRCTRFTSNRSPGSRSSKTPYRPCSISPRHWSIFASTRTARRLCTCLALGLFVLGLLSKTVTATLPAALLVVFWWQRGRLSWRRDVLPLLPFFALGAAAGVFTALVERKLGGAEGADFDFTIVERCLIAGRAIWFYLGKLFWPADLIFIYPRWHVSQAVWWQYLFPWPRCCCSQGFGPFDGACAGRWRRCSSSRERCSPCSASATCIRSSIRSWPTIFNTWPAWESSRWRRPALRCC